MNTAFTPRAERASYSPAAPQIAAQSVSYHASARSLAGTIGRNSAVGAARSSQGLDIDEQNLPFGQAGQPQVAIAAGDENWADGFGVNGLNGTVRAFAVNGTDLYAGGDFIATAEITVSHVAKWNGTSWSALGDGLNSTVFALAIYSGTLYAGGGFTMAGGQSASHIAKWDGAQWAAVGDGLNGAVEALSVYDGRLYAGGAFTSINGDGSASHVAMWDGSNWSPVGEGFNDGVLAFVVYDNSLYAGGFFTAILPGSPANYLARWDGSSWSTLPSEVDGSIYALGTYSGTLYAGGEFGTAGGGNASGIAAWDGSSWSGIGDGLNSLVTAFAAYDGALYIGGFFTVDGSGASANRIARWDSNSWSAVGSGLNGAVLALAPDGHGNLYVGGAFTTAGGKASNHIAKWSTQSNGPPIAVDDVSVTDEDTDVTIDALDNDSDPDGDTLSLVSVSIPEHGSAVISGTSTVVYTPTLDFSGTDAFAYVVSDTGGLTSTGRVTVTVNPINDAPLAAGDVFTVSEDIPAVFDVVANDSDVDGDGLFVSTVGTPVHGMATISDATSIMYTPTLNFNGSDAFAYVVSDGSLTATATVSLTVTPVDDAPTSLVVDGPITGTIQTALTFTATVSPLETTQPITYTWEASEQQTFARPVGLSDTMTFTWDITGTKVITITATNAVGTITGTHAITISKPEYRVHLPLVLRSYIGGW